jgi:ubiquinone/menaquinone biosynthesis C-methylase UbiE
MNESDERDLNAVTLKRLYEEFSGRFNQERFGSHIGHVVDTLGKRILRSTLENQGRDARVLDLGCGEGRITESLHSMGFEFVVPVDIALGMLETFSQDKRTNASALHLPFRENSFDLAVSYGMVGHLNDLEAKRLSSELDRVLKQGSVFLFSQANYLYYYRVLKGNNKKYVDHPIPLLRRTPGETRSIFSEHFDGFRYYGIGMFLPLFSKFKRLAPIWLRFEALLAGVSYHIAEDLVVKCKKRN